MHFDHLGIICAKLEQGKAHLDALHQDLEWSKEFHDETQKVYVCFAKSKDGLVYELVSPAANDSPISKTLANKSNILNHIAYRVPNLDKAASKLRELRYMPLGPAAEAIAFSGARIQFFLTDLRYVIELIELESPVHFIS